MKRLNFDDIMFALFVLICAPILILVFGFYGFIKALFSNEDDERLCD
jgi:uncharacterized membrane protein